MAHLPDYRPETFIRREEYLERLRHAFAGESRIFLLSGGPGSGKSILALQFAYEAQKDFEVVVFQPCGARALETIVAELGQQLSEQFSEEFPQLSPDQKLKRIKAWLEGRRSLLIFDDLGHETGDFHGVLAMTDRDLIMVADLFPRAPASVLITSHERNVCVPENQVIPVEGFSPEEAESAFRVCLGEETVERQRRALSDFAASRQRLPIAIMISAHLLRGQLAPLEEAAREPAIDKLRGELHHIDDLMDRAVGAQGETERRLLEAAATCTVESFWGPLAVGIAQLSEAEAAAARQNLVNSSLLQVTDQDRQRFQMHILLRQRLREKAGNLAALQSRHAECVELLFKNRETRQRECWECIEEIIPACQLLWRMGESERAASISDSGYQLAGQTGNLDTALVIARRFTRLLAGSGAPEARFRLEELLEKQAYLLQSWGRSWEALGYLKDQEKICAELGDKVGLQASYGHQALVLSEMGDLKQALKLLKRQEAICLKLGIKPDLGRCYWIWGSMAKAQGDRRTATKKLKSALQIFTDLNMPGERDAIQAELNTV